VASVRANVRADHDCEILECLITTTSNEKAALKSLWKKMRKHGQLQALATNTDILTFLP